MAPRDIRETLPKVFMIFMAEIERQSLLHDCIVASTFLTKTLHNLDVPAAYRLTVGAKYYNAKFQQFVEQNGYPETDAAILASNKSGARMGLLGTEVDVAPEGRWTGHMVVIIPVPTTKDFVLLDPTITQINRPDFGIVVPPICDNVTNEFVAGIQPFETSLHGTKLVYNASPNDKSYNNGGDYLEDDELLDVASKLAEIIKCTP